MKTIISKFNLESVDKKPLCGDATVKFQFIYFYFLPENRVQLGDHDLGPLLDGLKRPSDYVLAGKD